MSYYRSYFEKNNTIIKRSHINTAKNPDTEIYYGNGFSKYIFKIDLTDIKTKIDNGDFILDDNTTHYLHLTNTIFGSESLTGQVNGGGKRRATSFDLIIFQIEEYWDEGVGYDYEEILDLSLENDTYDVRPSNWYNRTSLNTWSEEGIYTGTPVVIKTIHFDNGNEDINEDITTYINDILTGSTENYGLGVTFDPAYELIESSEEYSVGFFGKYTQTFFEPYLETTFYDTISDDRNNFILNKENNLYLYVTKGGSYYDLDSLPTVDVLNSSQISISGLTGLTTEKIRKGIYKVTFGLDGSLCDGKRFFYDSWCNLSIDGIDLDCYTQRFIPKPLTDLYSVGTNVTDYERYVIQYYGIKLNEKIKRGEMRKVVVMFKSINQTIPKLFDDVYYRTYIKEGNTQVNVFDWTKLDKTNENSFLLDTSYLIPREYFIEIKGIINNEIIFYKNELNFEIIPEK